MSASFDAPRLVPPERAAAAQRRRGAASSLVLEGAQGEVYGSLQYARRRGLSLEFALDIVNATDEPLLATMYAVPLHGDDVPLSPYSLWVDARTEAYLDLPLALLGAWTSRALAVRLQGQNVHQRLEATIPRPLAAAYFLAGVCCAVLIALCFAALHPRIDALAAPSTAVAGTVANVQYALGGVGRGSWELLDLRGGHIDGGALEGGRGTVAVAVPRSDTQATYVVRIAQRGVFGAASTDRPIVAQTPQPSQVAPWISSLSIDRAQVDGGDAVTVRYRTNAHDGDVLAADAQGTIWAETPLVSSGRSRLTLPKFAADKELQVRVIVRSGRRIAQAGVGLRVIHADAQ